MSAEDEVRISHVFKAAIALIENAPLSSEEHYRQNSFHLAAVVRHIEIIGEAAKNISPELRESIPEIPWKEFMKTRDRFSHGYFNLDFDVIWEVATIEVPQLLTDLSKRFPTLDPRV
jgi:uncharacterized protein with HEPN domain